MERADAQRFRELLEPAMKEIAQKFGFAFQVGSISYGANEMHTKVSLTQVGEGIDPTDETAKYKANVKTYGFAYGVTEAMIGLKNRNGDEFIGIVPSRPKYPIAIRKPNGKIMLSTRTFVDGMKKFNNITG